MNKRLTVALGVSLLPLSVFACKHASDDDDDKIPSATPTTVATPPATVSVMPEPVDAGPPPSDAADDADAADAKKTGGGDPTGVRACCAALRQNAKSAPPEAQGAYLMAAGACDTMVAGGGLRLAQLRGMLLGAGLPSACK